MTGVCPICGRQLEVYAAAGRKGVLPWHKIPGVVTICPGSERDVQVAPAGQESLL